MQSPPCAFQQPPVATSRSCAAMFLVLSCLLLTSVQLTRSTACVCNQVSAHSCTVHSTPHTPSPPAGDDSANLVPARVSGQRIHTS
jgi:hypothetical protein